MIPEKVIVCVNFRPFSGQPSCAGRGSRELATYLEEAIDARGLKITVERTVCFGKCPMGPNIRAPGEPFLHHASKASIDAWLDDLQPG